MHGLENMDASLNNAAQYAGPESTANAQVQTDPLANDVDARRSQLESFRMSLANLSRRSADICHHSQDEMSWRNALTYDIALDAAVRCHAADGHLSAAQLELNLIDSMLNRLGDCRPAEREYVLADLERCTKYVSKLLEIAAFCVDHGELCLSFTHKR